MPRCKEDIFGGCYLYHCLVRNAINAKSEHIPRIIRVLFSTTSLPYISGAKTIVYTCERRRLYLNVGSLSTSIAPYKSVFAWSQGYYR